MKRVIFLVAMLLALSAYAQDSSEVSTKEIVDRMNKMLYVETTDGKPVDKSASPDPSKMVLTESAKTYTPEEIDAGLEACQRHGIYKLLAKAMYDCDSIQNADQERKRAQQREAERSRQSAVVTPTPTRSSIDPDRIQGLKAGSIQPANSREAAIKYDAVLANNLVTSPKLKPDGKNYHVGGYIEKFANGSFIGSFVPLQAIGSMPMTMNTRFVVIVPAGFQAKYQNTARIGGGVELIGRYVGNRNLELVMGNSVTVPVFEMIYMQ
jgi:hypothetical protein